MKRFSFSVVLFCVLTSVGFNAWSDTSCDDLRAKAVATSKNGMFEKAAELYDSFLQQIGCVPTDADYQNASFVNHKASGLLGPAYSQGVFTCKDSLCDLISAYNDELKKMNVQIPPYEKSFKYISRAIELFYKVKHFSGDIESYYFRIHILHFYRSLVITLQVPPTQLTQESLETLWTDLWASYNSIKKTHRFVETTPDLIFVLLKKLSAGQPDENRLPALEKGVAFLRSHQN